jgi:hypothetical protein
MKGSTNLMAEFFKAHPHVIGRPTWGTRDWFGFEKSEVQWFEERGCEIVKVCAGPGDVILWDSRTMHWNCVPETQNIRAIVCEFPLILSRYVYTILVWLIGDHRCMLYSSKFCKPGSTADKSR